MEAGSPGLHLGTLQAVQWEVMPATGDRLNCSKKRRFLYQSGEQPRAVSASASRAVLPACPKGTAVAQHSRSCAWTCWAERPLC